MPRCTAEIPLKLPPSAPSTAAPPLQDCSRAAASQRMFSKVEEELHLEHDGEHVELALGRRAEADTQVSERRSVGSERVPDEAADQPGVVLEVGQDERCFRPQCEPIDADRELEGDDEIGIIAGSEIGVVARIEVGSACERMNHEWTRIDARDVAKMDAERHPSDDQGIAIERQRGFRVDPQLEIPVEETIHSIDGRIGEVAVWIDLPLYDVCSHFEIAREADPETEIQARRRIIGAVEKRRFDEPARKRPVRPIVETKRRIRQCHRATRDGHGDTPARCTRARRERAQRHQERDRAQISTHTHADKESRNSRVRLDEFRRC